MRDYRQKIMDLSSMETQIDRLRRQGKKIVFTNGCFDILHPGHTRYLRAARQLGDFLVVAVIPQQDRTEVLAALSFVDGVVVFEEDEPLNVIRHLMPDVLVKGGDGPE
jgi:cytidyltransferase-like protein